MRFKPNVIVASNLILECLGQLLTLRDALWVANSTTLQLASWRDCNLLRWLDDGILEWQRVVTNELVLERRMLKQEVALLRHDLCQVREEKTKVDAEYGKLNKKYKAFPPM